MLHDSSSMKYSTEAKRSRTMNFWDVCDIEKIKIDQIMTILNFWMRGISTAILREISSERSACFDAILCSFEAIYDIVKRLKHEGKSLDISIPRCHPVVDDMSVLQARFDEFSELHEGVVSSLKRFASRLQKLVISMGTFECQKIGRARWRVDESSVQFPPPLLNNCQLTFVNRDDAMKALLTVHNVTYSRKKITSGTDWIYPICVNDYGCGKSSFSDNYQEMLKQLPLEMVRNWEVLPILQTAVHVKIVLDQTPPHELGEWILRMLIRSLEQMLENPQILDYTCTDLAEFVSGFLGRTDNRALFLVLDEIGAPFIDGNDYDRIIQGIQKSKFNDFILQVVFPLISCRENVFVLLCGRAVFLDWVGANPNQERLEASQSLVRAERISLNMIRPDKIVTILKTTHFKPIDNDQESLSLSSYLNLDTRSILEYAERLYEVTAGHPRTLCDILQRRCLMIQSEGITADSRPLYVVDGEETLPSLAVELIRSTALRFSQSATILIEQCKQRETALLNQSTVDGVRYRDLLPPLRISYQRANNGMTRLTIPQRVLLILESLLIPLHGYLVSVAKADDTIPLDFPRAFEIVVGKAFMELFPDQDSREHARGFFAKGGGASLCEFSKLEKYHCSRNIKQFPKVTRRTNCDVFDEESLTISPDYAGSAIAKFRLTDEGNNCWLIPEPMSHSPDIIHVSSFGLVMISVKNYAKGSKLSRGGIDDEISKAELMVEPAGGVPDYPAFLFIAATQYTRDIQSQFPKGELFTVLKDVKLVNIKEVILLDLTTPANRAEFFCCTLNEQAKRGLEKIIDKTCVIASSSISSPPKK